MSVVIGGRALTEDQVWHLRAALTAFLVDARRAHRKGDLSMSGYVARVTEVLRMLDALPAEEGTS